MTGVLVLALSYFCLLLYCHLTSAFKKMSYFLLLFSYFYLGRGGLRCLLGHSAERKGLVSLLCF